MGTTYEYTYEYEVTDSNKHNRTTGNTGAQSQRTTGPSSYATSHHSTFSRATNMDPLVNLQKDRIWNKLYDPTNVDKTSHEAEVQVCEQYIQINIVSFYLIIVNLSFLLYLISNRLVFPFLFPKDLNISAKIIAIVLYCSVLLLIFMILM
jgi:hypothetical protein